MEDKRVTNLGHEWSRVQDRLSHLFFSLFYNSEGGDSFFIAFVYNKPTAFPAWLTSTLKMESVCPSKLLVST
jgi:hypothetical protein